MRTKLYSLLSLIFTSCLIFACGVKKWPEPNLNADKLKVEIKQVTIITPDQYKIDFYLYGQLKNLKQIIAQIELKTAAQCLSCPFTNYQEKNIQAYSVQQLTQNKYLVSTILKTTKEQITRIRLKVLNRYRSIQAAYSQVYTIKNQNPFQVF
ncbi:MAG: hypothetical protein Q9M37_08045 [Desulfonauticus sp.]|nr:hypothetical protein [Desulfonauticus sp.]